MKHMGGRGTRSCFPFAVLMLVAVVTTCIVVIWIAFPQVGALTLATNDPAGGLATFSDRPAPDFSLPDLDGNQVSLSHFRGQPVVVNFWATWCPPCRTEMPHLIDAYEREQGKVVFLAISVDEQAGAVRRFAEEYDMPFAILLDDGGEVASDYQVNGIPVTFFISRDGQIVMRYVGQMSPRVIEEGLRRIR